MPADPFRPLYETARKTSRSAGGDKDPNGLSLLSFPRRASDRWPLASPASLLCSFVSFEVDRGQQIVDSTAQFSDGEGSCRVAESGPKASSSGMEVRMTQEVRLVPGGVTAPRGFRAGVASARIKQEGRSDVALLVSDRSASVAGVFTKNRIQGAHVRLDRERVAGGCARVVVINSGNANACTGPRGLEDARRMAACASEALGVPEPMVLVCSTGTIGIPLPMDRVERGIREAAAALSPDGGEAAARAIMTTDTVPKQSAVALTIAGREVRVGGMAKGSGMIAPSLATMLAVLTTDATVEARLLQRALEQATRQSFNRITVDGDQSCNDTVLMLANGASEIPTLTESHVAWSDFCAAVQRVALDLALQIVRDGEGASRFVTVRVQGATSDADAERAARAVAQSLLVKTSWFGGDPNWGRVINAVGYSGAEVREDAVEIRYDEVVAVREGQAAGSSLAALEAVLRRRSFTLVVDLHLGSGAATIYTCDCSLDYVRINAEYMT